MLIAGIDEAGRGSCLGPLVMAVTVIGKADEEKLIKIGVKDSKMLSRGAREKQFPEIKKIVLESASIHILPEAIDSIRVTKSLNEIEAMNAAKLLNGLNSKPDIVYVDSPDVVMAEFGKRIQKYLEFSTRIVSEHKADINYPVVSAASIIAKVERDNAVKELEKEFGELGSGYPHDEITIKFLKKYFIDNTEAPHFVRRSWQTIINMQEEKFQKKLF